MKSVKAIIILSLLIFFSGKNLAQTDTVKVEKKKTVSTYRRARTASIMSAVLPGAGQVYNKKYWKVPIIYAGLGGFGYLFYVNQERFSYYSKNLKAEYDDDASTINETGYSGTQLQTLKADYRKTRDLGLIGCAVFYALNILDANVDAHLTTFDVSDDLSLQIKPYSNFYSFNNNSGIQNGIAIHLNFK
ncbi:MAG: hypothetical protein J0L69_10605 [Bacteroidetes bacterium]|nr:hypothetical protein [Bacteroidota bacterium]